MDRVKVKTCVSTVIFDFWAKAAAKAWYSGNCKNDKCALVSLTCSHIAQDIAAILMLRRALSGARVYRRAG